jgi:Polyketide cyclase / dehydrase and lipid transport
MRIQRTIDVNASAADAWALLADGFGNEATWTTVIDGSYLVGDRVGVGAERHCEVSGALRGDGPTVERVTAFDPGAMTYSYEAIRGLPSFMKSARNTLSVTPLAGNRCRIHADARIALPWWLVPLGPVVALGAGSAVRKFLGDLQYRLEHGAPVPRSPRGAELSSDTMKRCD